MMHLPGLVMSKNMDKVINAVNQLGIVRGISVSDPMQTEAFFKFQPTNFGESEAAIIERLTKLWRILLDRRNLLAKTFEDDASIDRQDQSSRW